MVPAPHRVVFLPRAVRDLDSLTDADAKRVVRKVDALAQNPRPKGCRKLTGGTGTEYRIRVGDFRVLYQVADAVVTVTVVRLGNRRDVYRGR